MRALVLLALLVSLGAGYLLLTPHRERGLAETEARQPPSAADLQRILARAHDPSGRLGSGMASVIHDGSGAVRPGANEGRLYRTGFPGYEPTLGVTGNGWIFYVASQVPASRVLRSKDRGQSWKTVYTGPVSVDPFLWVDPVTDRIFSSDYAGCGTLTWSDDFGETWSPLSPVGCGYNTDHQSLYGGPPVSSVTIGYPNILYYCSFGGGALTGASTITACSRSLDGGRSSPLRRHLSDLSSRTNMA